jgi:TatD DNase family protein
MIEAIDIGVNLTNKSLLADVDAVLQRAQDAGVTQMVVTGTSIAESQKAIELCGSYSERLVSTCGIHPHHASEWDQGSYAQLHAMAQQHCVRAIGETGLDFNRDFSPRAAQEFAFEQQMMLAVELKMPLFCHQRDAHTRFVDMLREYRDRIERVVVHCFTDTHAALVEYLDLDCYIGITGWICDERRGLELRQLARLIPGNRLLLETDAPYLLPRNLSPSPANRCNEPAHLPHILREVAECQQRDPETLARDCLQNSRLFFNL